MIVYPDCLLEEKRLLLVMKISRSQMELGDHIIEALCY